MQPWSQPVCLLLLTLAFGMSASHGQHHSEHADPVDFTTDVLPILRQHCVRCHGPEFSSGGLRLDSREGAQEGGDSQRPILGGTTATNELYRRVSAGDAADRMPKAAPALDSASVTKIKRWVQAGTPWPAAALRRPEHQSRSSGNRVAGLLDRLGSLASSIPFFRELLVAGMVIGIGVLLVERGKRRQIRAAAAGNCRPTWIRRIGWEHYLIAYGCWFGVMGVAWHQATLNVAESQIVDLNRKLARQETQLSRQTGTPLAAYGYPPVPRRPDHPAALQHTYYRGNCERSPQLFNSGNYRTAELRISLRNAEGHLVQYGDDVFGRELFVRFELDRAPGTADALYSEQLMSLVFLSTDVYSRRALEVTSELLRLTPVEANWKWTADFPVGTIDTAQSLSGLIYVYKGRVTDGKVKATAHYGIEYDLNVAEDGLSAASEVWMGNLFLTAAVASPSPLPAAPDKVPLEEWFSHLPIPEITGENSNDATLLGIPEHVGAAAGSGSADDKGPRTSEAAAQ